VFGKPMTALGQGPHPPLERIEHSFLRRNHHTAPRGSRHNQGIVRKK
jgi:hypothetical protein